jgi:DNA polymerase III delta prime subunit
MSLKSIIGQPFAVALAERWLKQGSNNPLLLFGPEGVGKKKLALELAKTLSCQERVRGREGEGAQKPRPGSLSPLPPLSPSCDVCTACRKIDGNNHPDVRVIDRGWQALVRNEEIEKQLSLRIETILAERHRLLQSPVEGRWKVMILDEAHRLTPDAANALLKILEEPPADTAIFLVTPFRERLFTTILSRCRPVRFRSLSDEEMRQWQKRAAIDEIDLWAARGSPGWALHHSRSETLESLRDAEALWESLQTKRVVELVGDAEGRSRGAKVTRADMEDRIRLLMIPAMRSMRAGERRGVAALPRMEQALHRLRQNVQPGLVYDHLLISLSKDR